MADDIATRLDAASIVGATVGIKLRYPDWRTLTRDRTLPYPVDDAAEIAHEAAALMRVHWERRPVRLIGLRVAGLRAAPAYRQLPLFAGRDGVDTVPYNQSPAGIGTVE